MQDNKNKMASNGQADRKVDVYITIDTEIWCNGWENLDEKFPDAFKKYVYGPTKDGEYAIPATVNILRANGLTGVFFLEPLFSARFGLQPLKEMVDLLKQNDQEIQLHLHPEWLDECAEPIVEGISQKSPMMNMLSEAQQVQTLQWGLDRLVEAGADRPNAFRAGSYAADRTTLSALKQCDIHIDSSYNLASLDESFQQADSQGLNQPAILDDVGVYPVSVLRSEPNAEPRICQVTAISFREMKRYLETAYREQWDSVVIVSHNFEMLTPDKSRVDNVVRRRFEQLCAFLKDNDDRFNVRGFKECQPKNCEQKSIPVSSKSDLYLRHAEQAYRRLRYG